MLYDLGDSSSVRIITYDSGVGQSLYVFDDGKIYWVVYDPSTNYFIIICTSVVTETTVGLGIQYHGEICIAVDRLYIYVLDKDNSRIDVYSRTTLMKVGELRTTTSVNEITIAFGK